jgi:two-component system cell cycle sensor histidine kinase/response regulator CckA
VHQHQGWIETETSVGRGTTFRVFLPVLDPAEKSSSNSPFPPSPASGHEGILLVEDDEVVLKVTRAMLEVMGYRVVTAEDGDQALRLWPQHAAGIDLLLTDIVLPGGMSGHQLGDRLRSLKPKLKIVLMSGYTAEITKGEAFHAAGIGLLAKPFDSRTLASTLRRCLDSK